MVSLVKVVAMGLLATAQTHPGFAEPSNTQKPFEVDDMFMQEDMGRLFGGPYALSGAEGALAFTRVRAPGTSNDPQLHSLAGNARGDVWVQRKSSEPAVNVTNGARDNSSWWAPQWNRDGRILAMLSTRGGGIGIWIWDITTRQLRLVSRSNIDLELVHTLDRPFVWLDSEHLLYPTSASRGADNEKPATAPSNSALSVLESGIPTNMADGNRGELLLIDVRSGIEASLSRGRTRLWDPSPDRKDIAFVHEAPIRPPVASEPLRAFELSTWTAAIVDTSGISIPLRNPGCQFANKASLRWSPDGRELAFLGYAQSDEEHVVLCRVNVATRSVRSFPLRGMDTYYLARKAQPAFEWNDSRGLILVAPKSHARDIPARDARQDVWMISNEGVVKCITGGMSTPPRQLWARDDRRAFVGMADGHLWRLVPSKGTMDELAAFHRTITRIVWPVQWEDGTQQHIAPQTTYSEIVVSAEDQQGSALYLVNLRTGSFRPIQTPTPAASLVGYSPADGTGIFFQSDRTGLSVWRTRLPEGPVHEVFKANEFLREVEEAQTRLVEYTSMNGEKLPAWLMLPIGYRAGTRYPLITWVYAGDCPNPYTNVANSVSSQNSFNLQIPATNGYAVLIPCMPLGKDGIADEPMLRLLDGVMPAVDKAIDLGIADSERLFLMGHSFGGFSTYGIVTQTQRFKAAVAIAGPSDLISLYGQFIAADRHTDHAQENILNQALMEFGQTGMGNPPWKDLGRYLRNSPIFSVERVQTPLLIIQGDLDFVGIEQGEEFFSALYRQGKRAEFVRYWGEGHMIQQPDNVRDMWSRIFAWFQSNAAGAAPSAQPQRP
jgi:dipeptidyl aminopeptidase/acylaminoacyl peptidase